MDGLMLWWQPVKAYFAAGGPVIPVLCALLFLLWFAIGYRFILLRRGTRLPLPVVCQAIRQGKPLPGAGYLPEACRTLITHGPSKAGFRRLAMRLRRLEKFTTSLVLVAPLLGLLGTVGGMIETFDSLAEMALFSQSGGIAGGISKALFTTQMGLAVAVPGYFLTALLKRMQKNRRSELLALQDLLQEASHASNST